MRPYKVRWYDWLVYRLFYWRWGRILRHRADLREILIANLKASDVLDPGDPVKIRFSYTIDPPDRNLD